jgi:hypothetical protein
VNNYIFVSHTKIEEELKLNYRMTLTPAKLPIKLKFYPITILKAYSQ